MFKVGNQSHDLWFHVFLMEASVMTFVTYLPRTGENHHHFPVSSLE